MSQNLTETSEKQATRETELVATCATVCRPDWRPISGPHRVHSQTNAPHDCAAPGRQTVSADPARHACQGTLTKWTRDTHATCWTDADSRTLTVAEAGSEFFRKVYKDSVN